MRFFVTGATGFIGSAVVAELISARHDVLGLARSGAAAAALAEMGAEVCQGSLEDVDRLRAAASECDGVANLAFNHDFSQFQESAAVELAAIQAFGEALAGSGRPLVVASGLLGLAPGHVATELTPAPANASPRAASAAAALALADAGVRSSVVRLAPSVHDETKRGFVGRLVDIARETGVSGYVGEGSSRWPAVHRSDAARLFRLALEKAPAGSVLHGVGDEGWPLRRIAQVIAEKLDVPTVSISLEEAPDRFGFLAPLLAMDTVASHDITTELLGWVPSHPGLIEDLEHGHWFDDSAV